jgi:hypothetical protein
MNCLRFYYYTQNNRSISRVLSRQQWTADMSPQQWKMDVDTAVYKARIGTARRRWTWKRTSRKSEVESVS